MKKLLIAVSISVAAVVAMAAPASAQIYLGAQYGGGGVQAGPYDPGYGYADSYWNYRPGGYANGAMGGYNNSGSSAYGSYAYGGYGYPTYGYGAYGYPSYGAYGYAADPSAAADAYAAAPGADCRRVRERVILRGGRVTHRMRTTCD